jgi:hypothetical protein
LARGWIAAFGDIAKFSARVIGYVLAGRVFHFLGEVLRQAGILILGSALVIWGLAFILGLQCGIEGAYFSRAVGAPSNAGVFAAWCDLREIMPYAFGYMMSAKVGTGLVAEIGAMRISDEIDALEVMGINSLVFLCATRLLAAWVVLPFMYIGAVGAGFFASYLAVERRSSGARTRARRSAAEGASFADRRLRAPHPRTWASRPSVRRMRVDLRSRDSRGAGADPSAVRFAAAPRRCVRLCSANCSSVSSRAKLAAMARSTTVSPLNRFIEPFQIIP